MKSTSGHVFLFGEINLFSDFWDHVGETSFSYTQNQFTQLLHEFVKLRLKYIIPFKFYSYVYGWLTVHMSVNHMYAWCLRRTEVTNVWELYVGAESQTWILRAAGAFNHRATSPTLDYVFSNILKSKLQNQCRN